MIDATFPTTFGHDCSWRKWCYDLPKLSSLSVTWPVLPESFDHAVSSQLHHFSDMSEFTYGEWSALFVYVSQVSSIPIKMCINSWFRAIRCNDIQPYPYGHYHKLSGHSGRQHVLSLVRQKYWVVKANSAVRYVLTNCYKCRSQEAVSKKWSIYLRIV